MKTRSDREHARAVISALGALSLLVSLLLLSPHAAARPDRAEVDTDRLDAFFASQVEANNLKGMAVVIVKADGQSGGSAIYQRAFGKAGDQIPFTAQTPFPISSGSKSFLALSVMQLVDGGEVELDAPIQKYLPWWQVADPQRSAETTVRDLLNQVTGMVAGPGLYDDPGMSYRLPAETSMEDAVRDLRSARPKLPLRSAFQYFDPNYWTLAVLVEKVSGQSYTQYLHEHVFGPLGMKNSTTTVEGAPGMAEGNLTLFGLPVAFPETITQRYLLGCCGVITTTEDMGHYLIAQLNHGRYNQTSLVSPEGAELMHTPPRDVEGFMGMQYGMGWTVEEEDGITRVEDQGTWATYSSEMTLLPEQGYGIAMFYNQGCFAPQISGFPPILDGTIGLLTGTEPRGGLTLRTYGLGLAALALVTLGLEIFAIARLGRWARNLGRLPAWRKALDIGLPLVEAALLSFGFVYLVAVLTAKTFILKTALLWWTDLIGWLLVLSTLLATKAVARFVIWLRGRKVGPAPSVCG